MNKLEGITRLGTLVIVTLLMAVLFYPMKSIAWEMDTDRPGMDYKNFWIDKDTEAFVAVKQCEDACKKDPQCKAFTLVKPGVQGVHGRCYLKKGVPSPVKNTSCISGLVRPETAADRCKNYAATAVQQNQGNLDWKCGYSGPRWSSNYQAHYDWCMKVPKSSADSEETKRKDLLKNCWQPSTSGDLSAHDWCYEINKEQNKITFSPVIKNEGKNVWKSKKEGYYKVGVWGPFGIIEKKYTLPIFPHWYLEANETSTLEGLTLSYHPDNLYGVENLWILNHPEDTNKGNDSNPGLKGFYKGASFMTDPNLVLNMCKYYKTNRKFVQISFVDAGPGNGGNNEHSIYQNSGNKGWGDGAAIVDPIWIADGPDGDSAPDKNEPVCYTRSKSGVPSKLKVDVVVEVEPVGTQFSLVGMDGNTKYFSKDNIISTGANQTVSMVGLVNLPTTVSILTKTFTWKVILTSGQAAGTYDLGSSTHKIYVVYDTPITTNVEGQTNKLTSKRLDFSVGVASGNGNLVDIANDIAEKVRQETGSSYGWMFENPRWLFYARTNRNLDCHHRAALAASAFGIVGIKGIVHKLYATVHPVPSWPYGPNPTVNDYVSYYTDNRFKWRKLQDGSIQKLIFKGNNFEGNIRVEDDSVDDGNAWWTIWPLKQHNNAKELIQWYVNSLPQFWYTTSGSVGSSGTVSVPTSHLANKPKIIGGPN